MSERSAEQRAALAAKLLELRCGLGMSLEEVERMTDNAVAVEYLKRLEKGDVPFPAPHCLWYLSQAYNYPYEKLLETIGHIIVAKKPVPLDVFAEFLRSPLTRAQLTVMSVMGVAANGTDPAHVEITVGNENEKWLHKIYTSEL